MVSTSFIGLGSSGRHNSDRIPFHGVGDGQQAVFHHTDDGIPVFAIQHALIKPIDFKSVFESRPAALLKHAQNSQTFRCRRSSYVLLDQKHRRLLLLDRTPCLQAIRTSGPRPLVGQEVHVNMAGTGTGSLKGKAENL